MFFKAKFTFYLNFLTYYQRNVLLHVNALLNKDLNYNNI